MNVLEGSPSIDILGMRVPSIKKEQVLEDIACRISSKKRSYICLLNVYSTILFRKDKQFQKAVSTADFLILDGLPLAWFAVLKDQKIDRVRGSDLLLNLCELSRVHHFTHYFYGGEPRVPEMLAYGLKKKFPWLNVVGAFSPPFGILDQDEDQKIVDRINKSNPDILWVGLGAPKQEIWMFEHREKLKVPVLIGVGAAFDFLSGHKPQAPKWMQVTGLEWFFRFLQEPRRLWKRYLLYNSLFLILASLDLLKVVKKAN
jgi:N-acetylglucosaminyldiphosphoundecaprenol N-acetyl-beta-D-mannosaminyltransferase